MWTVQSWWGTNTTSRNAFYQAFHIKHNAAVLNGVAVLHYGKLTNELARTHRPVHGGSVKIHDGWTSSMVASKVHEKKSRDYLFDKTTRPVELDEGQLREWLTKQFGAAQRDELLLHLSLKAGDAAEGEVEIDEVAEDPVPTPTTVAESATSRPDHWGSW
jgi:hypothetical protein